MELRTPVRCLAMPTFVTSLIRIRYAGSSRGRRPVGLLVGVGFLTRGRQPSDARSAWLRGFVCVSLMSLSVSYFRSNKSFDHLRYPAMRRKQGFSVHHFAVAELTNALSMSPASVTRN